MAEGLLRHLAGDRFAVFSAGTAPKDRPHPLAVRVMQEIGIDISDQTPEHLDRYLGKMPIKYAIITCDGANGTCPTVSPGMENRLFWPFDDPAGFVGTEEEVLPEFRRVRDEIKAKLVEWLPTA
jgi:arsenate reductase